MVEIETSSKRKTTSGVLRPIPCPLCRQKKNKRNTSETVRPHFENWKRALRQTWNLQLCVCVCVSTPISEPFSYWYPKRNRSPSGFRQAFFLSFFLASFFFTLFFFIIHDHLPPHFISTTKQTNQDFLSRSLQKTGSVTRHDGARSQGPISVRVFSVPIQQPNKTKNKNKSTSRCRFS